MNELRAEELEFIRNVIFSKLDKDLFNVFIFGSRASGTAQKYSDIDIGVEGEPVPLSILGQLHAEFEDSNLPYSVDIVDFSMVNTRFKQVAKESTLPL